MKATMPLLQDVLIAYLNDRREQMRAQQRKFDNEVIKDNNQKMQWAQNAVVLMELEVEVAPIKFDYLLNQQLMYQYGNKIIATTPLAREILIAHWKDSDQFDTHLDFVIQKIFAAPLSEFTADSKGRALEKYIIRQLEKHQVWAIDMQKVAVERVCIEEEEMEEGEEEGNFEEVAHVVDTVEKLTIRGFTTIQIPGNKVPDAVDPNVSTLFIPQTSNYPNVDFILWDKESSTLWAVQVTILDPIKTHRNTFFDDKHGKPNSSQKDEWVGKFGGKVKATYFLWLGTNLKVDVSFGDDYIALLKNLDRSIFPLISQLVPLGWHA